MGKFSFYCEMCNKGFNNHNHYKTHMQVHEGIVSIVLKHSQERLVCEYDLSQPTGKYRFKCEKCGEAFNDKSKFEMRVKSYL